jgi:hypothetical protein
MNKWKIASAYVTGQGHIKRNIPSQDRTYKLVRKSLNGNFYGLALADGAGSYRYSDIGAEVITKKILYFLNSKFPYILKLKNPNIYILKFIERELEKVAKNRGIDFNELSSTLLFVAIKGDNVIVGHIGDGVIGKLNKDNELSVLSYPETGEYANSTFFTTSKGYKRRLRLIRGKIKNIKGFILMSDGTEESLYNKQKKTLADINKNLIRWLDKYSENRVEDVLYSNLKNIISKRTYDDCSLGIMYKIDK